MALIGLVRVSTDRQEVQRQHDALDSVCVRVFEETISGTRKATDRLGLRDALDYLRPGDLLTVQEVDRLGRNLLDGLLTLSELFQRGISVKVLDGIAAGEHTERSLILDLALALAEDRRRDISRKTKNGLDAAAKRGSKGGRPTVVTNDRRRAILARRDEGESIRQIARGVGVSTAVVHRILHEAEQPTDPAGAADGEHTDADDTTAPEGATHDEPDQDTPQSPEIPAPAERATPAAAASDAAPVEIGPRAIGTRVLATSRKGESVLVGFLDRQGRKWQAQGPHKASLPGQWRTRQEALLRLVEPHVG
ncbi:recombinase family protein [Haloactinomyces albus]|uniref:DNA invertase Pin-like site-specific DNA recombinase n=1 Tax=Haloactinomyces albus TaxID=1352928 RepID=A0AAE4CMT9_9ACTN|nr:recombinase family protein [Haloactinomyces albus]MDR7302771.1 DNA invertase Pin-like site-specific DNA recombinase [Haloactinomyces albus]